MQVRQQLEFGFINNDSVKEGKDMIATFIVAYIYTLCYGAINGLPQYMETFILVISALYGGMIVLIWWRIRKDLNRLLENRQ